MAGVRLVLDPRDVVGPPLRRNLAHAGVPAALLDAAAERYRAVYRTRAHEAAVYPGVAQALTLLREAGVVQAVATSKATDIAHEQLTASGLLDFFPVICGSTPEDGWSTPKARVIEHALAELRARGVLPAQVGDTAGTAGPRGVVMVGDRRHDVEGARAHGIPTVAVRWGYGTEAEWALAAASADTPAQLVALLGY